MRIDKFRVVLIIITFLFIEVFSLENSEIEFRKLNFTQKEAKRCISGNVVVRSDGSYAANEEYVLVTCTTVAPKCGFRVTSTTPPHRRHETERIQMSDVDFGCFSARLIHDSIMAIRETTSVFPADNFLEIYKYWYDEKRFLTDYFLKFRPRGENGLDAWLKHEQEWVENPPHDVFRKQETTAEVGALGMEITSGTRTVTPIMMFYLLFICFSVLFKLVWLARIAIKAAQLGYVPVANAEVEDVDRTLDEME